MCTCWRIYQLYLHPGIKRRNEANDTWINSSDIRKRCYCPCMLEKLMTYCVSHVVCAHDALVASAVVLCYNESDSCGGASFAADTIGDCCLGNGLNVSYFNTTGSEMCFDCVGKLWNYLHLWLSPTQCNAVYGFFLDGSQITTLAVPENVPFRSKLCFKAVNGVPADLRFFLITASPITASELYIQCPMSFFVCSGVNLNISQKMALAKRWHCIENRSMLPCSLLLIIVCKINVEAGCTGW